MGAEPFDLVLMDVQMPEMDGLDATRAIRVLRTGRATAASPIIAMTANAMAGDREMCLDAGMDGYVAKPVKKEALFAEIGRVLDEPKEATMSQMFDENELLERVDNDCGVPRRHRADARDRRAGADG